MLILFMSRLYIYYIVLFGINIKKENNVLSIIDKNYNKNGNI